MMLTERKRKAQEEYERRQAELEQQREEKETIAETTQNTNWETELKKAISEDQQPMKEPEYVGNFKIHGTLKELTAVKRFLDDNNITYSFKY